MASRKALLVAATAVVVVGALLPATATAATYQVGDELGWGLGVNYDAWASGKTFKVGDTLEFVYPEGTHTVVTVNEGSYDACAVPTDALAATSGNDGVLLDTAGQYFFICSLPEHCKSGMKLTINVQS